MYPRQMRGRRLHSTKALGATAQERFAPDVSSTPAEAHKEPEQAEGEARGTLDALSS